MILAITIYVLLGIALCYYNIHMEYKINRFFYTVKFDVFKVRPCTYFMFGLLWPLAIDFLTTIKDYTPKDDV